MLGPSPRSHGGMATVINSILKNASVSEDVEIEMWPTYMDGSLLRRVAYSSVREIAFHFTPHNYDIYHVHTASRTSFWRKCRYIRTLRRSACKVILHVHGGGFIDFWDKCTSRQKQKIRSCFSMVDKVIVLSIEWLELFVDRSICDRKKLAVLPNAVDIPDQNVTDYSKNAVLFLGRLDKNKSPDVLLNAAKLVVELHPDARFEFVGDGDISIYESQAKDLGVSYACNFVGWASGRKLENILKSNSIYCLPSKREAMPMSLLEAMSYGLVAVATNQGSIPTVIKDNYSGRLVEVDDHVGLARVLSSLMDSVETKRRLGESGRAYVEQQYGITEYAKKISELYQEVLCERDL